MNCHIYCLNTHDAELAEFCSPWLRKSQIIYQKEKKPLVDTSDQIMHFSLRTRCSIQVKMEPRSLCS